MGAPYCSRARSTISMARSTPAQKPRGLASRTSMSGVPGITRLAFEEALEDQGHGTECNRRIGDVESGPMPARGVEIEEIHDAAQAQAVDQVAERAAQHQRERGAKQALGRIAHDQHGYDHGGDKGEAGEK